jgi:hypothetical protein
MPRGAQAVPPPDQRARAYARHLAALQRARCAIDTSPPRSLVFSRTGCVGKAAALADAERQRVHADNGKLLKTMAAILARPRPASAGGRKAAWARHAPPGTLNLGARRAAVTSVMVANLQLLRRIEAARPCLQSAARLRRDGARQAQLARLGSSFASGRRAAGDGHCAGAAPARLRPRPASASPAARPAPAQELAPPARARPASASSTMRGGGRAAAPPPAPPPAQPRQPTRPGSAAGRLASAYAAPPPRPAPAALPLAALTCLGDSDGDGGEEEGSARADGGGGGGGGGGGAVSARSGGGGAALEAATAVYGVAAPRPRTAASQPRAPAAAARAAAAAASPRSRAAALRAAEARLCGAAPARAGPAAASRRPASAHRH